MRLGRKNPRNDKPRPIRVILNSADVKSSILRGAKNLKSHRVFNRIGIAQEKTFKEREIDRKLRAELEERKKKGKDVIIFRNEIISRKDKQKVIEEYKKSINSDQTENV